MSDTFTKEDWRREMLNEQTQDELYERLMRNDNEYFFEHSKYAQELMLLISKFKQECDTYDRDFSYEIRDLL